MRWLEKIQTDRFAAVESSDTLSESHSGSVLRQLRLAQDTLLQVAERGVFFQHSSRMVSVPHFGCASQTLLRRLQLQGTVGQKIPC